MGGLSAEREVSLRTGAAIAGALKSKGYQIVEIDVARNLPAVLLAEKVEVAFIALHGKYGEDGTVQGLLELMGLPYTGSGVLSSALAMDKNMTKEIFHRRGVPTPGSVQIGPNGCLADVRAAGLELPLVTKPPKEGSTIGICIARNEDEFVAALEEARKLDEFVLVEEFVDGRELTVGILNGEVLPIIEIVPKSGFYDYQSKYTPGQTEYLLPAPIDAEVTAAIQQSALQAAGGVGCSGAVRVDYLLAGDKFTCLEVNTIPGMTETSLLPKAAAEKGIDFTTLCEEILCGAGLDKR